MDQIPLRGFEIGIENNIKFFVYPFLKSMSLTNRQILNHEYLDDLGDILEFQLEKKEKNVIELASVYADRLKRLRAGLGRRDSFNKVKISISSSNDKNNAISVEGRRRDEYSESCRQSRQGSVGFSNK